MLLVCYFQGLFGQQIYHERCLRQFTIKTAAILITVAMLCGDLRNDFCCWCSTFAGKIVVLTTLFIPVSYCARRSVSSVTMFLLLIQNSEPAVLLWDFSCGCLYSVPNECLLFLWSNYCDRNRCALDITQHWTKVDEMRPQQSAKAALGRSIKKALFYREIV